LSTDLGYVAKESKAASLYVQGKGPPVSSKNIIDIMPTSEGTKYTSFYVSNTGGPDIRTVQKTVSESDVLDFYGKRQDVAKNLTPQQQEANVEALAKLTGNYRQARRLANEGVIVLEGYAPVGPAAREMAGQYGEQAVKQEAKDFGKERFIVEERIPISQEIRQHPETPKAYQKIKESVTGLTMEGQAAKATAYVKGTSKESLSTVQSVKYPLTPAPMVVYRDKVLAEPKVSLGFENPQEFGIAAKRSAEDFAVFGFAVGMAGGPVGAVAGAVGGYLIGAPSGIVGEAGRRVTYWATPENKLGGYFRPKITGGLQYVPLPSRYETAEYGRYASEFGFAGWAGYGLEKGLTVSNIKIKSKLNAKVEFEPEFVVSAKRPVVSQVEYKLGYGPVTVMKEKFLVSERNFQTTSWQTDLRRIQRTPETESLFQRGIESDFLQVNETVGMSGDASMRKLLKTTSLPERQFRQYTGVEGMQNEIPNTFADVYATRKILSGTFTTSKIDSSKGFWAEPFLNKLTLNAEVPFKGLRKVIPKGKETPVFKVREVFNVPTELSEEIGYKFIRRDETFYGGFKRGQNPFIAVSERIQDAPIKFGKYGKNKPYGWANAEEGITINLSVVKTENEFKKTLIHELQHWVDYPAGKISAKGKRAAYENRPYEKRAFNLEEIAQGAEPIFPEKETIYGFKKPFFVYERGKLTGSRVTEKGITSGFSTIRSQTIPELSEKEIFGSFEFNQRFKITTASDLKGGVKIGAKYSQVKPVRGTVTFGKFKNVAFEAEPIMRLQAEVKPEITKTWGSRQANKTMNEFKTGNSVQVQKQISQQMQRFESDLKKFSPTISKASIKTVERRATQALPRTQQAVRETTLMSMGGSFARTQPRTDSKTNQRQELRAYQQFKQPGKLKAYEEQSFKPFQIMSMKDISKTLDRQETRGSQKFKDYQKGAERVESLQAFEPRETFKTMESQMFKPFTVERTKAPAITKTVQTYKPLPPPPPVEIPMPGPGLPPLPDERKKKKKKKERRILEEGFDVWVNAGRAWKKISKAPLEKKTAFGLGGKVTDITKAFRFEVIPTGRPAEVFKGPTADLRKFYPTGRGFTEFKRFRADVAGERKRRFW